MTKTDNVASLKLIYTYFDGINSDKTNEKKKIKNNKT